MAQDAFFFFLNIKDFEFDFWKKPVENSEDVLKLTCVCVCVSVFVCV